MLKHNNNKTIGWLLFLSVMLVMLVPFASASAQNSDNVIASIKTEFNPDYPQKFESGDATIRFDRDGIEIYMLDERIGQVPIDKRDTVMVKVYGDGSYLIETGAGIRMSGKKKSDVIIMSESDKDAAPAPPSPPDKPFEEMEAVEESIRIEKERIEDAIEKAKRIRDDPDFVTKHAEIVRWGTSVHIAENERVEGSVVVFGGSINVEGDVNGDVVCMGGSIDMNGHADQDVVCIGGSISLGPDARVGNDVVSIGGAISKDPEAFIGGQKVEVGSGEIIGDIFDREWEHETRVHIHESSFGNRIGELFWRVLWVLLVLAIIAIIMVFFPNRLENASNYMMADFWRSLLVGIGVWIAFLPLLLLAIITMVICVGFILTPALVLFYILLVIFAYAIAALVFGKYFDDRFSLGFASSMKMLLFGVIVLEFLQVFGKFIALPGSFTIPLGVLFILAGLAIKLIAVTAGIGAVIMSRGGEYSDPHARRTNGEPLPPAPEDDVAATPPAATAPEIGTTLTTEDLNVEPPVDPTPQPTSTEDQADETPVEPEPTTEDKPEEPEQSSEAPETEPQSEPVEPEDDQKKDEKK